jgi:hypothetical protein
MAGEGSLLTGNTVTDAYAGLWLDRALTATHNTVTDCHTGLMAPGDGGHYAQPNAELREKLSG